MASKKTNEEERSRISDLFFVLGKEILNVDFLVGISGECQVEFGESSVSFVFQQFLLVNEIHASVSATEIENRFTDWFTVPTMLVTFLR